jgi:Cu/Ag efflux protein CusF
METPRGETNVHALQQFITFVIRRNEATRAMPQCFLYPDSWRHIMKISMATANTNFGGDKFMRTRTKPNTRLILLFAVFVAGISGCSQPKPVQQAPSRYPLRGRVVSIDKANRQVVVDAEDIPGYMMAMTMGYALKDASLLDPLSPGDQITADVMVNGSDVWLENVVVVKRAEQTKPPSAKPSSAVPSHPGKQ